MKDSAPATESAGPKAAIADLLSVDADAHLQKLAACMFPSPSQLPVELVRAALKRGASTVEIQVGNRCLAIRDDGKSIPGSEWLSLACAFDSACGAAAREEAIAALQSEASPGIGLLAVSLPGSLRILIESTGEDGKKAMLIEAGKVRQLNKCSGTPGSHISIFRNRGRVDAEKKLIRELCAAIPQEIVLNGRKLVKKPLLRRTLARQAVVAGQVSATVAIPARGDVCRIWLLDQGIPWQAFTCASYRGLVFDAALESTAPPAAAFFNVLAETAGRLYGWLAAHYLSFPEKYQERIEELMFKKACLGGDLHLLSTFTPFRLWRSRRRLGLEEVRRLAENEILYVLPLNSDPGRILPRQAQALLLTPLQKDFLQNRVGLPLATPATANGADGRLSGIFSSCLRKMICLAAAFPRRRVKLAVFTELQAEERYLCREMENQWQRQQLQATPGRPPMPLVVVMIEGRGLLPALWRHAGRSTELQLRRRHPLIRLALRSVQRDPANSELALAALAADIF